MLIFNNDKFIHILVTDSSFKTTFIDLIQCIINEQSEFQQYSYLWQLKNILENNELLINMPEGSEENEHLETTGVMANNLSANIPHHIISKSYSSIEMPTKTSEEFNNNVKDIIAKFNHLYSNGIPEYAKASNYNNGSLEDKQLDKLFNSISDSQANEALIDKQLADINQFPPPLEQYSQEDNLTDLFINSMILINSIQWITQESINIIKEEAIKGAPEKVGKLKQYSKNIQTHKNALEITDYNVFKKIAQLTPNFTEVIKFYKGNFLLNASRREKENIYLPPTPILLLGDPGIGKTYFAQVLAKELGTSFQFFDSNSITASWVLTGSSGQWRDADAGSIFKIMLESNTVSPVVIFDEIDKLSSGKNYDPYSTFHQLLEPTNAKIFKDEFLNINFDASNIIYILTANDISNIPKSLLSRMKVFNINKASKDHTRIIAQNIYKDIVGESDLLNPVLSEKNLLELEDLVPRDIKKVLKDSIFNQVSEIEEARGQELIISQSEIHDKKWGF